MSRCLNTTGACSHASHSASTSLEGAPGCGVAEVPRKGEDRWEVGTWGVDRQLFAAVYDGHNGAACVDFCLTHMRPTFERLMREPANYAASHSHGKHAAATTLSIAASSSSTTATRNRRRTCEEALSETFRLVDEAWGAKGKLSGATATVAAVDGDFLIVANVGDSLAMAQTLGGLVTMTVDHRADNNAAEAARCARAGHRVATLPMGGPLRVWPGGLMMTRAIGDIDVGAVILAEPETRRIRIPHAEGGLRLFLACDGLWDTISFSAAARRTSSKTVEKAAKALVAHARELSRDDISVLVLDVPLLLGGSVGGVGGFGFEVAFKTKVSV